MVQDHGNRSADICLVMQAVGKATISMQRNVLFNMSLSLWPSQAMLAHAGSRKSRTLFSAQPAGDTHSS